MNAILKETDLDSDKLAVTTPVEIEDLSRSVCHMIRRANLELARRFMNEVGHQHSIRPGVTGILMVTGMNPGIGQVDIAHQLGLDKANAAELIRSLETAQWITRKRSTQDRRRQGVYLTPAGVERLKALNRDMCAFEQTLALTAEERSTLLSLLRRMTFQS